MNMRKFSQLLLLLAGFSMISMAAAPIGAPEIDAGTGMNAIALLAGVALMIRGRRRS